MSSLSPPGSLPENSQIPVDTVPAEPPVSQHSEVRTPCVLQPDILCCAGLVICVLVLFWKTVLLGLPISRFGLIAEWDSLFSMYSHGVHLNVDPSAVTIGLPSYMHSAKMMHAGILPLWNQYNALGCPFVGDIQATVFSPVRMLLDMAPGLYVYNLQLVIHVVTAALGTFALARTVGVSRTGSMLSAFAYALCPFVLWYLELQTGPGYILNPAMIWLFARAAHKGDYLSAITAGIGAGVMVLSGHPEVSFYGILYACLLMALLGKGFVRFLKSCTMAGIAAFCVSAPVFLPFVEFMRNSDCYKFAVSESAFAPWQGLAYNLLAPGFGGASPFPGCLVAALAVFALTSNKRKQTIALASMACITLVVCGKVGPLAAAFSHAPLNYLITVYAVPLFILSVVLLAGFGLDAICNAAAQRCWKVVAGAALLVLVLAAAPELVQACNLPLAVGNFDLTLPAMVFSASSWKRDIVIAGLAMLAFGMMMRLPLIKYGAILLLVLNTVSVCSVAKSSLAVQPVFNAPMVEPVRFLCQRNQRSVATGGHLAIPNINGFFGFEDLRERNAMWPRHYRQFAKVCGADLNDFDQRFTSPISNKIDLASVKYVLSQTPITAMDDLVVAGVPVNAELSALVDGARIEGGNVWRDKANRQANGVISWDTTKYKPVNQSAQLLFVLVDKAGRVDWFGDRLDKQNVFATRGHVNQQFSIPLPDSDFQGGTIHLKVVDGLHELADYLLAPVPTAQLEVSTHFKLIKQFSNNIRIYENTGALPRAYIVPTAMYVPTEQEALNQISRLDFDPRQSVIMETGESDVVAVSSINRSKEPVASPPASFTALQTDHGDQHVEMTYSTAAPGYLVLTDSYYPGWNAYLDNVRVPISRANYMFRGIAAPAGSHTVVFRYEPISFMLGVLLFGSFWSVLALILARRARNRK